MKHMKFIISLLLMLLAIILIVENLEQLSKKLTLRVDLFFWAHETPPMALYLVIIMVFLLGIFVASSNGIFERFKLKKRIRLVSKENREKDRELNSFRNLPIGENKIEDKGLVKGDQG
ncbi:MAG: hypothetical protein DRG66_07220 [Deltaproteobacteria bacterium]|nr:MAG: hypothetical protein DRG66_07220 [Deltaproteobacteria bacterium]